MDMKTKVKDLQKDMGIIERVECSIEEQKDFNALMKEGKSLPEDVFFASDVSGDYFYREKYEVAPGEQELYLLLYQTKLLKTIKNCLIYFTVLSIVSLVLAFIMTIS